MRVRYVPSMLIILVGLWGDSKKILLHEEMNIGIELGDESEMFGYIPDLREWDL